MSGLARLFLNEGKEVSGSDIASSPNTKKLESEGAQIIYEQKAENIAPDVDFVVYTEAMNKNHPEMLAAKETGIKMVNYFEALGMVANEYYLIAVSGTHGKSTTTAMLVDIFEEAGLDPSAIVGSLRSKTKSNYRRGKSKYMIAEACEYRRDFLYLEPNVLVITNIEHEHVDYYKDLNAVQEAFRELALKVPETGAVVCETANDAIKPVVKDIKAQVVDYRKFFNPTLNLKLPGIHNRMNAAAAFAAAAFEGIERKVIDKALENYAGIWRRFEHKGEVSGAPVYDDYAHHPTEIKAAIAGARERYPDKKLTVIFQSHTYTRTHELFNDFVNALGKADRVFMLPIYAAREENESGVSSEQLVEALKKENVDAGVFANFNDATVAVKESVGKDDVVIVMGAGDITKVADMLIAKG